MNKNTLFTTFLLCATLIFSACASGPLTSFPWDFSQSARPNAAGKPGTLSDDTIIATAAQEPAAGTEEEIQTAFMERQYTAQRAQLPSVKVAILLPLSGANKKLGQSMLKAAQMALFDIGYENFELIPQDTKGTSEGAREAARNVVSEGAQLVLGPLFSNSVRAVKEVTGFANIPVIAFTTDWTLAGKNTYVMGFLPFDQIERIMGYAKKTGINRIGVITPNTDYGRIVQSATGSIAPQIGIHTTKSRTFLPGNNNLSLVVREFASYDQTQNPQDPNAAAKPKPFDAVLMPVGGNTAISIGGLLSEYGLHPNTVKRLGTGLFDNPALAREHGLAGGLFAAPSPKLRQDFENRFKSTYGYFAPRLSTLAYDATALAVILAEQGLRQNGRPAYHKEAITNANGFSGIDGIFRFRPNGTAERGLAVLTFKNGTIQIIDDAPQTFQAYRPF